MGVEISFCAVSTRTQCYESRSEIAYPPAAHLALMPATARLAFFAACAQSREQA